MLAEQIRAVDSSSVIIQIVVMNPGLDVIYCIHF